MKLHLRKVRLSVDGYTKAGKYFGVGKPLYRYFDEEGEVDSHLRATDRADAVAKLHFLYPNAKIMRP